MRAFERDLLLRKILFHQIMIFSLLPLIVFSVWLPETGASTSSQLFYAFAALAVLLTGVSLYFKRRFLGVENWPEPIGVRDAKEGKRQTLNRLSTAGVLCTIPSDVTGIMAATYLYLGHNSAQAWALSFFWAVQYSMHTIAFNRLSDLLSERWRKWDGGE